MSKPQKCGESIGRNMKRELEMGVGECLAFEDEIRRGMIEDVTDGGMVLS